MRNSSVLAAGAFWLTTGLLAISACAEEAPVPVVVGDLIVKFRDGSEANALAANAMTGQPATRKPLTEFAIRLGAELGTPLMLAHLSSGRELVLSVDREQLVQRLTDSIRRDPGVRAVTRVENPPTLLPYAKLSLDIELLPDSATRREVQKLSQAAPASPAMAALIKRLTAGFEPTLTGQVNDRGQLQLTLDIEALTGNLLTRIKRRDDVEYAQLSHIVRPFAPVSTD